MSTLRFDGLVVLVTGAGAGLGRQYALDFAARGASVVVNDLGGSAHGSGSSSQPADQVVRQIVKNGGRAVANYDSVESGEKLVKTAIDHFGKIDIVVNNAGILRDRSFGNMSDEDWDLVHRVHLKGAFSVTRAAWPYMKKQKFGRVIFTTSPSGLYGNFGQANYCAAKLGLLGLCKTLSLEGAKYNIVCNTIAPTATSRLTEKLMHPEMVEQLKPEYIAPLVVYLCHPEFTNSGGLYELAGGWVSALRWQRTPGRMLRNKSGEMTAEMVRDQFDSVCDYTRSTNPDNIQVDSVAHIGNLLDDFDKNAHDGRLSSEGSLNGSVHEIKDRDTRLYALSLGVKPTEEDLKFIFESHEEFCVIPTYSTIGAQDSLKNFFTNPPKDLHLDFNRLLHGEQYTELFKPYPTSGCVRNEGTLVDKVDKGSGTLAIFEVRTYDERNDLIALNQYVFFLRGSGGFGGKTKSELQKPIVQIPSRIPELTVMEKIDENQSAVYRLNGDPNPVHIDPNFAAMAGFAKPILHGLCSYGIVCRHVIKAYAGNDVTLFKAMKARFSKPVLNGQTLKIEMWREGKRIHVQARVVETNEVCLDGGYVDLHDVKVSGVKVTEGQGQSVSKGPIMSSDRAFDEIRKRVEANPALAKRINAVFLYNITVNGKLAGQWTVDLTGGEPVYRGEPRTGKAACTFTISDSDMLLLVEGKLDPQKAFMSGKLKFKGNMGLVQKFGEIIREKSKL